MHRARKDDSAPSNSSGLWLEQRSASERELGDRPRPAAATRSHTPVGGVAAMRVPNTDRRGGDDSEQHEPGCAEEPGVEADRQRLVDG